MSASAPRESRAGVLALQGAFAPHIAAFARLGVEAREVRRPEDLAGLTHLVLPGGESTTIRRLMDLFGVTDALVERYAAGELALFGVCAGAILLGKDDPGEEPPRLGLLDAVLARNAYGRQVDSFSAELDVLGEGMHGVFIRAPRFARVGQGVRVLGRLDSASGHGGEPVLVEEGRILAVTFHPELSGSDVVHARFLGVPLAVSA